MNVCVCVSLIQISEQNERLSQDSLYCITGQHRNIRISISCNE